jgi:hypothetical protein
MSDLVYDIETGPLPLEQIAQFYVPPIAVPPWSDDNDLELTWKLAERMGVIQ